MSAKSSDSIKVAIKVRPLLPKEKDTNCWWKVRENSIHLIDSQSEPYYFDYIFDQDAPNEIIFNKTAKHIVHSAVQGFNGTIFAYGQTSSGKTYTMMGDECNPGVMILAVKEIFNEIQQATDRQFLLRVGYIEIYNEKIYDLLNKKNQDLKIHETPNGIVGVNCEECIIMCEDDLLNCLNMGNKERTVGETNMNERSSRSHAIFRIIIESRKIDRSGDVMQSVLNLVDLAGSERADQTGARGTRLKEGGHINKSLLFLSNVIKRLSENEDDKYISYRDSKLTRILQASLGGNALTSIICTIKPNAIEETQSTLSFAMRAKIIKNKPQINEIISDATMMKRLEREIQDLKACLDEERRKNESKIKVGQLEERIKNEVLKIITCNSLSNIRSKREKRRRTWCGKSTDIDVASGTNGSAPSNLPVSKLNAMTSSIHHTRLPKPITHFTPLITMRYTTPETDTIHTQTVPEEAEEQFIPGELCSFGNSMLKTPDGKDKHVNNNMLQVSITPISTAVPAKNLECIEHALKELQEFTNLETKIDVKHETYDALKQQLQSVMNRNKELEHDRLELIALRDELVTTKDTLTDSEQRCDDLQVQISKLTNSNLKANEKISQYEAQLLELNEKIEKLEVENREVVSLEFEFQRHKNKSKLRETELLELLEEKEKQLLKLEKKLQTITEEKTQGSKEELLHLSQSSELNDDDNLCIKCIDLQRVLDENTKVLHDFEKVNLKYQQLELELKAAQNAAEETQRKICQLELQLDETVAAKCSALEKLNETETKLTETLAAAGDKTQQLETDRVNDVQVIAQLREEIAMLQGNLEQLQQENLTLNCDNNEKTVTTKDLQRIVENTNEEMRVLKEKFNNLEMACQEQVETIATIQAEYDAIQVKYQKLQAEYEKLEHTSSESRETCERLQRENSSIQVEIVELRKRAEIAQNELLGANNDECKLMEAEKIATLETELAQLQRQYEEMQNEYDDLSNQLMESLQDNETLRMHCTKLQTELTDLTEQNGKLTNQQSAENARAELRAQVAQLQHEVNEKNALLNATERTVAEMQDQMKALQEELFEKSVYVEKCEVMRTQIEHLEKERAEITMVCEVLQEKVKCSHNDSTLNEINETITGDKSNCFNSTSNGHVDNNQTMEQLNETQEEQLSSLQKQLDDRVAELSAKVTLIEQLEQKLKEQDELLATEIRRHEEQLQACRDEIELINKTHKDELDSVQLELLQKLEDSEAQFRENLKKYNHEWEEQKNDYERTIETLSAQLNNVGPANEHAHNVSNGHAHELAENEAVNGGVNGGVDEIEAVAGTKLKESSKEEKIATTDDHNLVSEEERADYFEQYNIVKSENDQLKLMIDEKTVEINAASEKLKLCEQQLNELQIQFKAAKELQAALEAKNDSMSLELVELQQQQLNEREQFESSIKELKDDLNLSIQKQEESEATATKLNKELQLAKAEHEEVLKEKSELAELIAKLEQDLQAKAAEYSEQLDQLELAHTQKLQALTQQIEEKTKDMLDLQAYRENLETQLCEVQEKHVQEQQALNDKIEQLNTERGNLHAQNDELETELKRLKNEIANEKTKLSDNLETLNVETEGVKAKYESTIKILEANAMELRNENVTLNCEINELKLQLDNMSREMATSFENLNAELTQTKNTKALLEMQLTEAKAYEQQYNQLLGRNENQLKTLHNLNVEIASIKAELERVNTERETLETAVATLNPELTELKQSKLELEKQLAEANEYKTKCNELLSKNDEQLKNLKTLEDEMASLKVELDNSHKERDTLQKSFEILNSEFADLKETTSTLTLQAAEAPRLKLELDNANKENENLKTAMAALNPELIDLRQSKTKLEKQLEEANVYQQQCNDLLQKNEQQLKSLDAMETTMASLKLELENVHKEKAELQASFENLNPELADLKQTKSQLELELRETKAYVQQVQELRSKSEKQLKALEFLKAENSRLSLENAQFKEALETATTAQQEYQHELASISAEAKELRETIISLNHEKQYMQTLCEESAAEKAKIQEMSKDIEFKFEALQQELNEARTKLLNSEKLLAEQTDIEALLQKTNAEKLKLANEVNLLKTQLAESKTLGQACKNTAQLQIENLEKQLKLAAEHSKRHAANEEQLSQKLKELQETFADERSSLLKENQLLSSQLDELKLKCKSLEDEKLRSEQMNVKVDQALQQAKLVVDAKERMYKEKCSMLEGTIASLQKEQKVVKEKLCLTEEILKKFEKDRERDHLSTTVKKSSSANNSLDSSLGERISPRLRGPNENPAVKVYVERKNRRISVHDDNRPQECWDAVRDNELMTGRHECNCIEKLKEYEKQLFIRESQVTALNLEIKNHPLREENATLIKRLKSEQEKYITDVKRYKSKINDLTCKVNELTSVVASSPASNTDALAKSIKVVVNAEAQTEFELDKCYQDLLSKYKILKGICRSRYERICELEGNEQSQKENTNTNGAMSSLEAGQLKALQTQCEVLKKELKQVHDKYKRAKQVLHMRREEIEKLREELDQITTNAATVVP